MVIDNGHAAAITRAICEGDSRTPKDIGGEGGILYLAMALDKSEHTRALVSRVFASSRRQSPAFKFPRDLNFLGTGEEKQSVSPSLFLSFSLAR